MVGALVLLGLVTAAVGSLGAPLLPTVVVTYGLSLPDSQWALTISLLVGALATPLIGRLGSGHHRRAVMLATLGATALGCVLSAVAGDYTTLLAGRALQGLGYAIVPLAIAAARDALPSERVGPAVSLLGVTAAAGVGVGYPLAGLLVERWGLPGAFWLGAAVSAGACVAAWRSMPSGPRRPRRSLDLPGSALLGAGTGGILVALAQGNDWGWGSRLVLGLLAVSLLGLMAWVRHSLHCAEPLIDLRLLRHRSVLVANVAVGLTGLGIYPLVSLVVRLVEAPADGTGGLDGSPFVAGLMLVPFSLASLAASRIVTALAQRRSPEWLVIASSGPLLAAEGVFLMARGEWLGIGAASGLAGLGLGGVLAATPLLLVRGVPPGETSSAAAFSGLVRSLGYSAGSALSATLLITSSTRDEVPTAAGYDLATLASIGILSASLVVTGWLVLPRATRRRLLAVRAS